MKVFTVGRCWLVFVFLYALSLSSFLSAAPQVCEGVFRPVLKVQSSELRFSQNFIGHYWGMEKFRKLKKKFKKWKKQGNKGSKKEFVLRITKEKPLLGVRLLNGEVRLIDNHHSFFSMTQFLGDPKKGFNVFVGLKKDYQQEHSNGVKDWSEETVLEDLLMRGYMVLLGDIPRGKELAVIPNSILEMPDSPERSLMSLIFASFAVKMKGSDFKPMTQFLLIEKMRALSIKLLTSAPYSPKNLKRLKYHILNCEALLRFLKGRLANLSKEGRSGRVLGFFQGALLRLRLKKEGYYFKNTIEP